VKKLNTLIKACDKLIIHFEELYNDEETDSNEESNEIETDSDEESKEIKSEVSTGMITVQYERRFEATEKFTEDLRKHLYELLNNFYGKISDKKPIDCTQDEFVKLWEGGDSIDWYWNAPQLVYLLTFLRDNGFIKVPTLRNNEIFNNALESGNQFKKVVKKQKENFKNIANVLNQIYQPGYTEERIAFLKKKLNDILLNDKTKGVLPILLICDLFLHSI
jgi:hypothetical protein